MLPGLSSRIKYACDKPAGCFSFAKKVKIIERTVILVRFFLMDFVEWSFRSVIFTGMSLQFTTQGFPLLNLLACLFLMVVTTDCLCLQ